MRLRVADRILVAVAGLLLLCICTGIVAQMFLNVDLIQLATKVFNSERTEVRVILIAAAVLLFFLGIYCVCVLFRHRKRKDKFILQKNDNGELAISVKALENMVNKCLDQHDELDVKNLYLENKKDGLLIRIRGAVAGGISIPLTVEALQKQIRQYVTACSGVEVKGIRVQIESSGEDAKDAPFAIAAPAAQPRLQEAVEKQTSVQQTEVKSDPEPTPAPAAPQAEVAPAPQVVPPVDDEDEDDDRPLHQRLFSTQPEPCIVPAPPVEPEEDTNAEENSSTPEKQEPTAEADDEKQESSFQADPSFVESLKAFDNIVTGETKEGSGE
ncbi:MAG: alkaline shock response membrane anchor protein AmaP [Clostridia bacterium]|nr:alkaline shock response membrane anchor protein AmaP [Clostridia bacterium]